MIDAGFLPTGEPGIWEARVERPELPEPIVVPVDLIVPEELAPKAGRRAARLPGEHGTTTARKSVGLEGAVVDNDPITISALSPDDARQITVKVAGPAALFVAKNHKLGERLARPERLQAKDAGDIYRLYDLTSVDEMAAVLIELLDDPRSSTVTQAALTYAARLFLTPTSPGVELATAALRGTLQEPTVAAAMTIYTRTLLQALGD